MCYVLELSRTKTYVAIWHFKPRTQFTRWRGGCLGVNIRVAHDNVLAHTTAYVYHGNLYMNMVYSKGTFKYQTPPSHTFLSFSI